MADTSPATVRDVKSILVLVQAHLDSLQPGDPDLTLIAALTTTPFGRGLLELADASAALSLLGIGTGGSLTADTDATLAANSDARVATQRAVKTYVDALLAAQDAMVFKGVVDCSANPNYPAADCGHTYRVSVAGKVGGAAGVSVEAGDVLMCLVDGTASGTQAAVGTKWNITQANLDGAVIGPAGAADNGFVRFDGITGRLVKDGGATISLTTEVAGDLPFSSLAQGTARSVLAVTGNATADFASLQGTASQFLGVNAAGTALGFQTMGGDGTLSGGTLTIAAGAVTYAKMQNVTSQRILGRMTAGSGVCEELAVTGNGTIVAMANNPTFTGLLSAASIRTTIGSGGTITAYESDVTRANRILIGADATGGYLDTSYSSGGSGVLLFKQLGTEAWRFDASHHFLPGADNTYNVGSASKRANTVFAGTGTINTSDEREKTGITEIPGEWLDAWGDVQWVSYRLTAAVEAKGEGARWHVGLAAQRVRDAFAARGLDALLIGLLCHDEWPAERAVRARHDRNGELIREARPAVPAGDRWGLRYDECQAMEAAYQRRWMARVDEKLEALIPIALRRTNA